MKYLPIIACAFVFSTVPGQAEEAPQLPDLPETQTAPSIPDSLPKGSALPDYTPSNQQSNQRIPRMSQEQLDKANKEKNWLTEGLKAKELQAAALREEEAQSQKTIIDEILERNQQQMNALESQANSNISQQKEAGKMKAALSTTAWEPLQSSSPSTLSYAEAMGESTPQADSSKAAYKQIDEQTGISNVFYNPTTGTFSSQPYEANANRPEQNMPWMQQGKQTQTAAIDLPEKKQVENFEAQLLERARAQNKLPQNYQDQQLNITTSSSPLLANNSIGRNTPGVSSNLATNPITPQNSNNSGYAASAAKLRMMEEERQRNLKEDNRPNPLDLHSPFKGKGVDINPRF